MKKIIISITLGCIGFIIGGITSYNSPSGNTSKDIKDVEIKLEELTRDIGKSSKDYPHYKFVAPGMEEVLSTIEPLIYENKKIAIAKVMIKIDIDIYRKDLPWYAPKWENRYEYGNKPWLLQEKYQLIAKSIGIGIICFIGVFVFVFLFMYLVSWTWLFLLERIKELSAAIRGNNK